MQNFKNNTNELMYKREADLQIGNKLMVTKGEDINQVYDITDTHYTMYKIYKQDVLYSTGNYIHYFIITNNARVHTHIYIFPNHFAVHLKLINIVNQLYFNKKFVKCVKDT